MLTVRTVTVLGAGAMGGALAALLADAGMQVHLLDLPSDNESDAGSRLARSRLAQAGIERMQAARPAHLYDPLSADRIRVGNLDDDFEEALRKSDWILEAVTEDLDRKRQLWRKIAEHCPPTAFATSNTSGLPLSLITEELPVDFKSRCFGAHFFNPPRYLPLLELIPISDTDPELLQAFARFAQWRLGREVVQCEDTPYFIGNRFFAYLHLCTVNAALKHGLSTGEVDSLTGPLLGRPRTGTFRLADVVGVDVMRQAIVNLRALLPEDSLLQAEAESDATRLLGEMHEREFLGVKSGRGFWRAEAQATGGKTFLQLDLQAALGGDMQYADAESAEHEWLRSLLALPLRDRLPRLLYDASPYREFLWDALGRPLAYLSRIVFDIARSVYDVDRVMRWGFGWQAGPFEIWDALGTERSLQELDSRNVAVADWVRNIPRAPEEGGGAAPRFHSWSGSKRAALHREGGHRPVPASSSFHGFRDTMDAAAKVVENASATLRKGRDDVLLLELHSKLNTIDDDVLFALQKAREAMEGPVTGLIIAGDGDVFSAGANLRLLLADLDAGNWSTAEERLTRGQNILHSLRESPKPVVVAMRGLALGGGAEIVMAADRVVAHRETQLGLVEARVGLIPCWGGTKEMVKRRLPVAEADRLPSPPGTLAGLLQDLGESRVSAQAQEARGLGFLGPRDIVIRRSSQLLERAAAELLSMQADGFAPVRTESCVLAAGRDSLADLRLQIHLMREAGRITEYDAHVASKLARVLCGGDLHAPAWMDDRYFLELEREAGLSLAGESRTRDRMKHLLDTGRPLRN